MNRLRFEFGEGIINLIRRASIAAGWSLSPLSLPPSLCLHKLTQ